MSLQQQQQRLQQHEQSTIALRRDSNNKTQNKKRILSIQSHVVSGYVGNKAAVFPLQLLGYDVDIINSVHFSNHTGYINGYTGDILRGEQLLSILMGLQKNHLLDNIGHILTGYIGSESFLYAVLDVIKTIRSTTTSTSPNNNNKVRYVCDPVLGDQGKLYVPQSLVQVYIDQVIPLADVITPNQFEVEQLTGIQTRTIDDAILACNKLHTMGPSLVFITSLVLEQPSNNENINDDDDDNNKNNHYIQPPDHLAILASVRHNNNNNNHSNSNQDESNNNNIQLERQEIWQIDCPILPGQFTGTGDVTAALLLAHTASMTDDNVNNNNEASSTTTDNNNNNNNNDRVIPQAMEKVINTMFAILERTNAVAQAASNNKNNTNDNIVQSRELQLIQSKDIIEYPPTMFSARRIR